jgi:CRP-like cAMP-binding protein
MTHDIALGNLENLLKNSPKKQFAKGEFLLETDQEVNSIFLIIKGFVRHYTVSDQGIEFTHNILKPHSLFPFHLALNRLSNPHYFEALTEVEVRVASCDQVASFLQEKPEILLALTKKLASGLNQLTFRLESLQFGTAQQKLAAILYLMGKRFGKGEKEITLNTFSLTHQLLASMTGLTRETISLEMMSLKKQGLIDYRRQQVKINDMEKLREISSLPFYY